MQKTALNERHRTLGAKMTDFHGWEMPLYYASIIEEHHAVRQALGLFDISHMGQVLVIGPDAAKTLDGLMTNDIGRVAVGHACYTLMLSETGGVLDDLIVYRLGPESYLVIVNCGHRESDTAWMAAHRVGDTSVTDISQGRSMLAVQGPRACRVLEQILDARVTTLERFGIAPIRTMGPEACIARTGYTGGDGFELFLPDHHARQVWDTVLAAAKHFGGLPVGLGARDTLRVEAGLRLYGLDLDPTTSPYEADLAWTVALNKGEFIGRGALVAQQAAGVTRKFAGFELSAGPVPRAGCELFCDGRRVGVVTSGTYSPTLSRPLGMGYVEPACAKPGTRVSVTVRYRRYVGTVVKMPFWKGETKPVALALSPGTPTLEKLS